MISNISSIQRCSFHNDNLTVHLQLLDKRTLPQYAYRDDGLMLHKCIETYVKKVLKHYYSKYM